MRKKENYVKMNWCKEIKKLMEKRRKGGKIISLKLSTSLHHGSIFLLRRSAADTTSTVIAITASNPGGVGCCGVGVGNGV